MANVLEYHLDFDYSTLTCKNVHRANGTINHATENKVHDKSWSRSINDLLVSQKMLVLES
jgi:hypothetical protein